MFAAMSALGFAGGLLIIAAYKSADAAIVAPMQYSQLVWAAGFGFFIFAEFPDLWTWTGAAVIIASGLYIVLRESLRGATSATPVLHTRSHTDTGTRPRVSAIEKLTDAAE
jgi:S-adenosylmethionine uptake transporter